MQVQREQVGLSLLWRHSSLSERIAPHRRQAVDPKATGIYCLWVHLMRGRQPLLQGLKQLPAFNTDEPFLGCTSFVSYEPEQFMYLRDFISDPIAVFVAQSQLLKISGKDLFCVIRTDTCSVHNAISFPFFQTYTEYPVYYRRPKELSVEMVNESN